MLALKKGTNSLNNSGGSTHELFADVSTRKLESISVGESSGKISKGIGNAFVGFESGKHNIEGSFGVFVGYQAGTFNQNANLNTYVGAYSGQKNNRGTNNTFIGFKSGQLNADGSECTAIGVNAMRENSVGNRNVAVGFSAGERLLEGDNNTIIGSEAGQNIRSGNLNTMAGYRSGRGSFRGNQNTYFGAYSGYSNSEGNANSLIGYGAGEFLISGNLNVAVGAYSLQNLSNGNSNTSVGAFAGTEISGSGNVLVGTSAAAINTLGNDNTIIGQNAAYNTVGDKNVVIGSAEIGSNNSLSNSNNYSNTVIIGYKRSNAAFKSGSDNIFIGSSADTFSSNASNAIAIGIGSESTLVSSSTISIGKEIQNIGTNSVLMGYNIYSDSENCVSIGHDIRIDNVNVFFDPLNSTFSREETITSGLPIALQPRYTQTIEIGRLLNSNVAAATVYSEKEYDSINKLRSGTSVNKDTNLLESFDLNIEFRPITIEQTSDIGISTSIANYIFENNLVVSSIADTQFNIDSDNTNLDIVNTNITVNNYEVTVGIGTTTSVSYNLIPSSNFTNKLNIHVARRLNIEFYSVGTIGITKESEFMNITGSDTCEYEDYIYKEPAYGYLIGQIYNRHIESLYAENDIYSIVRVNKFTIDSNNYNIIPEEKLIKYTEVSFNVGDDTTLDTYGNTYITSNIYLHQWNNTVFDKSYLNVITESTNTISITINSIDSNLILTYNDTEYDSTTLSSLPENIPYTDFTFLIKIKDNNASIDDNLPIDLTLINGTTSSESKYTFNCIHTPIMDFIETFSQDIDIEPFSIEPITISRRRGIIIRSQPNYGIAKIEPDSSLNYTPTIFNFGQDTFTISITRFDSLTGTSYSQIFTINIYTRISTTKTNFDLTKFQESPKKNTTTNTTFTINGTLNIYKDMYDNFIYSRPPLTDPKDDNEINQYKTIITHNITTIQLQDTTVYNYGATYDRSDNINNDRNLVILKEGEGEVVSFTQDEISQKKIHIHNKATFFVRSGDGSIFFKNYSNINNDIQIKITYIYNSTIYNNPKLNRDEDVKNDNPIDIHNLSDTIWTNINHTNNVAFINGKPLLIDPTLNEESYFEYVNTLVSRLHKVSIQRGGKIIRNNVIYLNAGFEREKRYLTPSDLLFVKDKDKDEEVVGIIELPENIIFEFIEDTTNPSNILFKKEEAGVSSSVTSFTQKDINDKAIYIETTNDNLGIQNINCDIKISGVSILDSPFTFTINIYLQNQFIQDLDDPSSNVLFQFNSTYKNELVGGLWEYINNDDVDIHITKPPINGFLYVEESVDSYSITNMISFATLRDTILRYIPYVPMDMQNDTYECVFKYKGRASPTYTIVIKNYWSKWGALDVPNTESVVAHINNTYRSKGMIDDEIFWETNPDTYHLIPSIKLANYSYTEPFAIKLENVIQRKVFSDTSLEINLVTEIYGNVYFNDLFSTLDKYEDGENVIFFIITAPTNGAILRESSISQFEAVAHFDTEDIINNKVFYQHFGNPDTTIVDTIKIKVGTNNYDLSNNTCTINISVIEPIVVSTNLYDYIYHDNIADGKSNFNLIDTNRLDLSTDGVIHLYGSSNNVELFIKDGDKYIATTSFTKEYLDNNVVFYKPLQSFFDSGSNPDLPLSFKFTTTNTLVANKLATFYESFFVNTWVAKYNTFESKNTKISEITIINEDGIDEQQEIADNQIISYTAEESFTLKENKTTFEFEYLPMRDIFLSPILDDNVVISEYTYTFELVKLGGEVFFSMEFTTHAIHVKYNENTYTIDKIQADPSVFEFNTFKILSLVVNDNLNNGKLSIYINSKNYTLFSDSDPQKPLPTISDDDLVSLRIIRITVPIINTDTDTDKNSNSLTLEGTTTTIDGTTFYYNLENYSKSLFFRNFKILSQLTDQLSIYNIVIGDKLDIKGVKNICIGQNFSTSGQGSIIIGNDIGRDELTSQDTAQESVNEILNSIVISTDSFKNTRVRDIIAIGNDILNEVSTGEDIIKMDEFLSKKPVLIGNNINTTKLDYHINFENTFLKTTVGFPQIYCGLSNEAVCIGYSSNMTFNNDLNKLYVNNNAIISGNLGIGTTSPTMKLDVIGDAIISGNLGIGTTNPIGKLHVVGDIHATGTHYDLSDRRLKSDIKPITNALSKIASIEGVTYLRNDILSKRYAGLIAQDVEKVLPEVVHTMDNEESTKSIAYGNFSALLVQGINELSIENSSLKNVVEHSINTSRQIFRDISINNSSCRLQIQTFSENAFTIYIKFKAIESDTKYISYNFENWLKLDNTNNVIILESIVNSSKVNNISNLSHIVTSMDGYIHIDITWSEHSSEHNMYGIMEVETVMLSKVDTLLLSIISTNN